MDNNKDHTKPTGTKLTAVTIGHAGGKVQFFAHLRHDSAGKAMLPLPVLNAHLNTLRRGETYTIG
jgi:hypothetical protein